MRRCRPPFGAEPGTSGEGAKRLGTDNEERCPQPEPLPLLGADEDAEKGGAIPLFLPKEKLANGDDDAAVVVIGVTVGSENAPEVVVVVVEVELDKARNGSVGYKTGRGVPGAGPGEPLEMEVERGRPRMIGLASVLPSVPSPVAIFGIAGGGEIVFESAVWLSATENDAEERRFCPASMATGRFSVMVRLCVLYGFFSGAVVPATASRREEGTRSALPRISSAEKKKH